MTTIIEQSEHPEDGLVATVRTARGDEYRIVVDEAVKSLADLFSDHRNEKRNGWELHVGWWETELKGLLARVTR